ncbi:MAG TPA: hypothetical protein VJZ92_00960 [Thermodesulfobacteriota bacterium]|nr:hypothetical protein [Thermodesulfobacteriota bacterium]
MSFLLCFSIKVAIKIRIIPLMIKNRERGRYLYAQSKYLVKKCIPKNTKPIFINNALSS